MENFRKIAVSERMPNERKHYPIITKDENFKEVEWTGTYWFYHPHHPGQTIEFWLEPTPSLESEYREALEKCKLEFELFRSAFGQGSNMIQEIEQTLNKK